MNASDMITIIGCTLFVAGAVILLLEHAKMLSESDRLYTEIIDSCKRINDKLDKLA